MEDAAKRQDSMMLTSTVDGKARNDDFAVSMERIKERSRQIPNT